MTIILAALAAIFYLAGLGNVVAFTIWSRDDLFPRGERIRTITACLFWWWLIPSVVAATVADRSRRQHNRQQLADLVHEASA